jgi:branched-chain amino acid transport system ATP-binding protein
VLRVKKLEAFYGDSQVLFGMDFTVEAGEVVTLLGRNGSGKSSTIRAIMGLLPTSGGSVVFDGRYITGLAPYKIARLGMGPVLEGRRIFPNLTVRENMEATARPPVDGTKPRWNVENAISIFPALGSRLSAYGNQLSGGEQQMLAIARAMMTHPRLLILDEATEGLAPMVRKEIWEGLASLKEKGQAILVVDKHLEALARIAQRHYIVSRGSVVWTGTSEELLADRGLHDRHLGV